MSDLSEKSYLSGAKNAESAPPRNPVCRAVRELRIAYGESQQAFAYRMRAAIRSIARYETTRPPRGAELGKFLQMAIDRGRNDLAAIFAEAIAEELGMRAERIPLTIEEGLMVDLLLLSARNRSIPEVGRGFERTVHLLVENFRLLADKLRSGETVYGLNADDLTILEGEVSCLSDNPPACGGEK